jgi:hypothetical protein
MPPILSAYSAPNEIISKDEWKKYAKECRKNLPPFGLTKMKESVAKRLISKYEFWDSGFRTSPDWFSWTLANWGTKWNIDIDEKSTNLIEDSDGEAIFHMNFLSAWSGPYIWFKKICEMYNLTGEYIDLDEENDYFHKITYKNGKLIKEIES